jgi:DDE superfamily endonuclease
MPPLPEAIILVLAAFAPLFSHRVWPHAPFLRVGALLAPGARTVTAARRVMGLSRERHVTNAHRVVNRATWSARQAGRLLLGLLVTSLGPPGAPLVLGADDTVGRRRGRQITAKGGDRDAGRSTRTHVIHCCGLTWGVMLLVVPGPWSRRVWALPCLTAWCRPAAQAPPRRHKTRVDGVRQMRRQARRWLPGRSVVWVVAGGLAAVSLALAGVTSQVTMVSRLRWEAALSHPPGPQPQGKRGPKPTTGQRQRRVHAWAERSETLWETVTVAWSRGPRQTLGGVSHTGLWHTPGLPPVEMRFVIGCDPEGKRRMAAFFCPDRQATPGHILAWVVRRWSVEVTVAEARAQLGRATPRPWSDLAIARTTPVRLARCARVTLLALRLSHGGPIPVETTAWYHKTPPTFVDCWALVRRHLWRAR